MRALMCHELLATMLFWVESLKRSSANQFGCARPGCSKLSFVAFLVLFWGLIV